MSDEAMTRSEAYRRYLRGEITYQEMRTVEDRYHRRRDTPSTRVAEPIRHVPSTSEVVLSRLLDEARTEAWYWRRLFWAMTPLLVAALVVIVMLARR